MSIPALSVTKQYQDGRALTEAQLDAAYGSIETWAALVSGGAITNTDNVSVSGLWTFAVGSLLVAGAGAGKATLQYANSATDRTLTFPDPGANDTVVTLTANQTLTTKTLTSPTINSGALSGTLTGSPTLSGAPTLNAPLIGMVDKGNSAAGTVTCDCSTASKFLITATGNFTLAFSNFTNGQRVEVWILQDGTGSRTVTWPTETRWLNGTGATNSTTDKPTLTTTANKFDVISFERFDVVGTDANIYAFVRGFKGAIT